MRLIPRSFLWRTILMILIPLVITQVIVANAFFGNHWSRVHDTLARTLAGEITTMTNFIDSGKTDAAKQIADGIKVNFSIHNELNRPKHNDNHARETGKLAHELLSPKKHVEKKYYLKVNDKLDENDISAFE
ncbi:MAG: hypothetical protein IKB59_01680, partial [Alphaproteobacteria bacterium]|nr:hypothetical protein [Alphaproteobacteria bacterium]